jgi:hypothetical protein
MFSDELGNLFAHTGAQSSCTALARGAWVDFSCPYLDRVMLSPSSILLPFEAFILLIGFAIFVASLVARFPAMLRHLRALPVGAARLNALLVLWPAAIWLVAWTGWLSLHYLVLGADIPSYHVDVLLGVIGVSAIVQAMALRFSGFLRAVVFVSSILAFVPGLLFVDAPPPAAFAAIGAGLIAGAVMLNVRSLARKSTYDPVGLIFGVMPTTQNWK